MLAVEMSSCYVGLEAVGGFSYVSLPFEKPDVYSPILFLFYLLYPE